MKLKRRLFVGGAVAASLLATAPAAFATTVLEVDGLTWTLADIAITAPLKTGTTVTLQSDYAVPGACSTSVSGGYVKRGVTVAANAKIGAITSMTLSGCTMTALGFPVTITKQGTPEWGIFATTTPTAGLSSFPVEIRGIAADIRSTGSVPLVGELGLTGTLAGTFNQVNQTLTIYPAPSMTYPLLVVAYTGAGTRTLSGSGTFAGQVYTGDRFQMTGSFRLSTGVVGGSGIKLQ